MIPQEQKKNGAGPVITDDTSRDVDAYLETLIEAQRVKLIAAESAQARRDAWYSMKSLIECRSPVRIRQMEITKGLSSRRARTV